MLRLQQEEFNRLRIAGTAAGTGTLSEFVRTRVLRVLSEPEFADFERRFDTVKATLTQLIKLVAEKRLEPGRHSGYRKECILWQLSNRETAP